MALIKFFVGHNKLLTQGNGKTLTMGITAYRMKKELGYELLANYELEFSDEFFTPEDINQILEHRNNVIILFDEFHTFVSAYDGVPDEVEDFRELLRQLRKKDIYLMATAQVYNDVPRFIRRSNVDVYIVYKIHLDKTLCKFEDNKKCDYKEHRYVVKKHRGKQQTYSPHLVDSDGNILKKDYFYSAYKTDEIVVVD